MKKIRLSAAELDGAEVLTREQLKTVFGGISSDSGSTTCNPGVTFRWDGNVCWQVIIPPGCPTIDQTTTLSKYCGH